MGIFGLSLCRELNVDCALESASVRVLDYVDVLDGAKDFTNLLNHFQCVRLREVRYLKLIVHA